MSRNSQSDLDELRRAIDRLREDVAKRGEQIDGLDSSLSDFNTKVIASLTDHFDGNVYRKALEHDFKEHVYTKIRNFFGAIAIIAGIGGFFFVQATIERMVGTEIRQQQSEFIQASENLTRERLLFLLREIRDGNGARMSEVRDEEDFVPLLRELIESRGDPVAQDLAINYAGEAREEDLIEAMVEVLRAADRVDVRVGALEALLKFLPNAVVEEQIEQTLVGARGPERDALWGAFASVTSIRPLSTSSAATREMMSRLMREALRSTRADIFRAGVLFFLTNQELWDPSYGERLVENVSALKKKDYIDNVLGSALASSQSGDGKGVSGAMEFLAGRAEAARDPLAREQIQIMENFLALAELRAGRKEVMAALSSRRMPYFPDEVWQDSVRPRFTDVTRAGGEAMYGAEPVLLQISAESRREQEELWRSLDNFDWDLARAMYAYSDPEQKTVQNLLEGDLSGFLDVMASGYYEPARWLREVLPLFPDWLAAIESENPIGTDAEQDALWYWVRGQTLKWNGSTYESLGDATELSIQALSSGDLSGFLEVMATGYYEPARWLEAVLPLFPGGRAAIDSDNPIGTEEEQDALWYWVQEQEPGWDGSRYAVATAGSD